MYNFIFILIPIIYVIQLYLSVCVCACVHVTHLGKIWKVIYQGVNSASLWLVEL